MEQRTARLISSCSLGSRRQQIHRDLDHRSLNPNTFDTLLEHGGICTIVILFQRSQSYRSPGDGRGIPARPKMALQVELGRQALATAQ